MFSWRWPRGLGISGRSFCDVCRRPLLWYQNIPLLSAVYFRGRCVQCGKGFEGLRYFAIEASMGVAFVLTGYLWQKDSSGLVRLFRDSWGDFSLVLMLSIVLVFVGLFVVDLEKKLLPDVLSLIAGALIFLLTFFLPSPLFFNHLAAGLFCFIFFLSIFLITNARGMGFGDVKMAFFMGLLLGSPLLFVWLILSFVSGGTVGVILLFLRRATLGQEVPFGPFLLVSAYIVLFFGEDILSWYINLL